MKPKLTYLLLFFFSVVALFNINSRRPWSDAGVFNVGHESTLIVLSHCFLGRNTLMGLSVPLLEGSSLIRLTAAAHVAQQGNDKAYGDSTEFLQNDYPMVFLEQSLYCECCFLPCCWTAHRTSPRATFRTENDTYFSPITPADQAFKWYGRRDMPSGESIAISIPLILSMAVSASISWTSASNISKETISCDSQDYDYTECPLDKSGKIINAIVDIQHSNGSCEFLNSTAPEDNITKGIYGYSNDVLWVHGGCGAIFLVWYITLLDASVSPTWSSKKIISENVLQSTSTAVTENSSFLPNKAGKASLSQPDSDTIQVVAILIPLLCISVIGNVVLVIIIWKKRVIRKGIPVGRKDDQNCTSNTRRTNHNLVSTHRPVHDVDNLRGMENDESYETVNCVSEESRSQQACLLLNHNVEASHCTLQTDNAQLHSRTTKFNRSLKYIASNPPFFSNTEASETNTTEFEETSGKSEKYHNNLILEAERKTTAARPDFPIETNKETSDPENGKKGNIAEMKPSDGCHDYFVLEKRDYDSMVNPIEVVTQTLPSSEYNVLNTSSKGGTITSSYEDVDYSHLEKLN